MITLNNNATQRRHERLIAKMIQQGRYAEMQQIINEHNRLLEYTEHIPCSEITRHMTPQDHEECNRLLRKICILSDIIESAGIDLLAIIKRYDAYVTLPLLAQCRGLTTLAGNIRGLIDAVGNIEYAETFGDLCDTIDNLINRAFEIEKEKSIIKQCDNEND